MMQIIGNSIINMLILIVGISLTIASPLKVETNMDISGSLNKLCGNDPSSSDELPSCNCLNQFRLQSSIHAGQYRGKVDSDKYFQGEAGFGDLYERVFEKPGSAIVGAIGIVKTAGLKCIDDDGQEMELGPIYDYILFARYFTAHLSNNQISISLPPFNSSSSGAGIQYKTDLKKSYPATVKSAVVKLNDSVIHNFNDLGTHCEPAYPQRTLEANLWAIVNKIVTNSSADCNIPKNSWYPINYNSEPMMFTVNEPLDCGKYEVKFTYSTPEGEPALWIYVYFELFEDKHCAPIKADKA